MHTLPIDGEVITLIKIEKQDGTTRYLRAEGEISEEITREQYEAEGGA